MVRRNAQGEELKEQVGKRRTFLRLAEPLGATGGINIGHSPGHGTMDRHTVGTADPLARVEPQTGLSVAEHRAESAP